MERIGYRWIHGVFRELDRMIALPEVERARIEAKRIKSARNPAKRKPKDWIQEQEHKRDAIYCAFIVATSLSMIAVPACYLIYRLLV